MTWWEFGACVDGWNRSQGGKHHNGDPLSDDEYDALCAIADRWNDGGSGS